ncbi:polyphosphate kinase 2 family protein [Candidatus Poribacteria bacterium]|nr:polyphosphate kinase 2 family protein [Candidatus Poribacteria bacterium]
MLQPLIVPPGTKIKLKDYDAEYAGEYKRKSEINEPMAEIQERMRELQGLLYAESKHALLIILQAMDAGGKDGTIRKVISGVNPQGCDVVSFKVPSAEEIAHDFLWRIHKAVPPKGKMVIFNRSHYEDVLVVRVHNLVPKEVWRARYDQINSFEKILVENGTVILKFFLHISKAEQKKRFEERLADPTKHWKFAEADVREREYWDDYMEAYEDAISKCSTEWAPWYIVPANKKWYRDLVVGETIVTALKDLNMKYPALKIDPSTIKIE